MYHTSLSKIKSAGGFLLWFRSNLPPELQQQLRPYLAQPYQSALKVLDCCSISPPMSVTAIAQQTQLSPASVRQVLKVLQSVECMPDICLFSSGSFSSGSFSNGSFSNGHSIRR